MRNSYSKWGVFHQPPSQRVDFIYLWSLCRDWFHGNGRGERGNGQRGFPAEMNSLEENNFGPPLSSLRRFSPAKTGVLQTPKFQIDFTLTLRSEVKYPCQDWLRPWAGREMEWEGDERRRRRRRKRLSGQERSDWLNLGEREEGITKWTAREGKEKKLR